MAQTAAPNKSKIMETVVEVGRPKVLNKFKSSTSPIITAKKISITSLKVNICGWKTPDLATSIIPEENVAPKSTPKEATTSTHCSGAMRHPTAELRKFTASLLTPTNRSIQASTRRKTTSTIKMESNIIVSHGKGGKFIKISPNLYPNLKLTNSTFREENLVQSLSSKGFQAL